MSIYQTSFAQRAARARRNRAILSAAGLLGGLLVAVALVWWLL